MRLVWVVIPLVLIGIIGIQESFAESHFGEIADKIESDSRFERFPSHVLDAIRAGEIDEYSINLTISKAPQDVGSYGSHTNVAKLVDIIENEMGLETTGSGGADISLLAPVESLEELAKYPYVERIIGYDFGIKYDNEDKTQGTIKLSYKDKMYDVLYNSTNIKIKNFSEDIINFSSLEDNSTITLTYPRELTDTVKNTYDLSNTTLTSIITNERKAEFFNYKVLEVNDNHIKIQWNYLDESQQNGILFIASATVSGDNSINNEDVQNDLPLIPPLKQIKLGTSHSKITCNEGLELIFKVSDNSPACVKPSTAEKLIERGWTINKHSSESIILYSSKLNDDSTDGSSSAPGVVILNDQEITLSKIPKLGETAIISVTINLKPEFSDFSGSMSTQKIMLESGFSFVNIDASILTLTPTNLMSYSESLPVTLNIPTVFQFEITPTKVGNWMVHVDGGNYKQRHTFNFIVNEDETILGEKPQAPSGIGGTVSGEGDFIISKIEPNTDENEIVEIIPVDTVDFSKTIVDDGPLYHSVLAGVPVALYRSLEYPEFIKIGDEFDVTMKWTFTEYDEEGNIEHQSVPINSLTKEIFNETFLLIKIPENIEMITGVSDWEETVKVYHDTSYNFDSEITTYTKTIPLDYTDAMHEQTYRFKLAEPFFPPFDHMTFGGLGFLTKFIFHQDGALIPPQLDAASINALQSDITVERLGSVDPQYPDVPSSEVNWGRVYEIATKGMNTPSDPDESQTQDIRDFYVNVLKRNPTNDELLNTGVSQTWIDSFFEKFPELK